uniref:Putative photolyase-cryptochrome n=1 Tax=Velamen paralellum TaxID=2930371 RepID=A0A1S6WNF7_9METZ|nr:putative photolyase-cryptochrome [Velamen paralellum]
MSKIGLHWFRYGLRLHDNPPLLKAIKTCSKVIPLYILDTDYFKPDKVGINRIGFLLDTLKALDSDLRAKGSRLFVAQGNPNEVIRNLIQEHKVELLSFERDTEPYNKHMDNNIIETAKSLNVETFPLWGHTMFDPEYLLEMSNGKAPLTMTSFLTLMSETGDPPKPLDPPESMPSPIDNLKCKDVFVYEGIPTLSDLKGFNFDPKDYTTWFVAGEKEAIKKMTEFLAQKHRVSTFEKPKTLPTALQPDTTALSPYITRGSLSSRLFYHSLKDTLKGMQSSKPPVSLKGQLYWREMAYLIGFSVPNFNQMEGNPICKQIPWLTGEEAKSLLEKWEMGQTGYPAVDAVMNQLRTEGWMHHLARHLVACYLTRGDLWVTWELGRDVFDKHLVDADWSINNFSWHWLSCSAFFHQYFRCYSPVAFFKKTDPNGNYIKKHVPILAKFPDKYIYEPWTAPKGIQTACGCIIGKDYPKPMVDHKFVSKENMDRMKKAYDAGKAKAKNSGEPPAKKLKQNKLGKYAKK